MTMKNPIRAAVISAVLLAATASGVAQLGLAVTAGARQPVSSSLIVASATEAIRACAYEARNQMISDLEARLMATNEAISGLSGGVRSRPKAQQEQFESALKEMKSQEGALRLGMQAAGQATEKTWPQVRAALAFSYIDYVSVVTRAERIGAGRDD
jgi:sensor domain CHASE-containing protein